NRRPGCDCRDVWQVRGSPSTGRRTKNAECPKDAVTRRCPIQAPCCHSASDSATTTSTFFRRLNVTETKEYEPVLLRCHGGGRSIAELRRRWRTARLERWRNGPPSARRIADCPAARQDLARPRIRQRRRCCRGSFRRAGLGPLVGTRAWAGLVGISPVSAAEWTAGP